MELPLYNQTGEKIGKANLSERLFDEPAVNQELVRQVAQVLMDNQRRNTTHTKDRSERRGGGRKPWRQKGTGRARHGSIRSPLWRKGGVTFGPRNDRNYKAKVNQKMRQQALRQVLSDKARQGLIRVFNDLKFDKTSQAANLLKKLKLDSTLVVGVKGRAWRNLPRCRESHQDNLNLLDLLRYKHLILIAKQWQD